MQRVCKPCRYWSKSEPGLSPGKGRAMCRYFMVFLAAVDPASSETGERHITQFSSQGDLICMPIHRFQIDYRSSYPCLFMQQPFTGYLCEQSHTRPASHGVHAFPRCRFNHLWYSHRKELPVELLHQGSHVERVVTRQRRTRYGSAARLGTTPSEEYS